MCCAVYVYCIDIFGGFSFPWLQGFFLKKNRDFVSSLKERVKEDIFQMGFSFWWNSPNLLHLLERPIKVSQFIKLTSVSSPV